MVWQIHQKKKKRKEKKKKVIVPSGSVGSYRAPGLAVESQEQLSSNLCLLFRFFLCGMVNLIGLICINESK